MTRSLVSNSALECRDLVGNGSRTSIALEVKVYPMRGLRTTVRQTILRNAAWFVRAARRGKANSPVVLAGVIAECVGLVSVGGELGDVVEVLCELLVHP